MISETIIENIAAGKMTGTGLLVFVKHPETSLFRCISINGEYSFSQLFIAFKGILQPGRTGWLHQHDTEGNLKMIILRCPEDKAKILLINTINP